MEYDNRIAKAFDRALDGAQLDKDTVVVGERIVSVCINGQRYWHQIEGQRSVSTVRKALAECLLDHCARQAALAVASEVA